MAYATGTRMLSALCFIIGGLTLVGIPLLWPIGYVLYKRAAEKEQEREQELEALAS